MTIKDKKVHRIKIIKGHVSAIEKMIVEDKYCVDILHQSLAVQKSLKQLDKFIMSEHLKHCVTEQTQKGEIKKVVADFIGILNYK